MFEYDHDFSSNGFLSLKIEYVDKGLKKAINIKPALDKNTLMIKDFNKDIHTIKVVYELQYDRLTGASFIDGEEVIWVKQ